MRSDSVGKRKLNNNNDVEMINNVGRVFNRIKN